MHQMFDACFARRQNACQRFLMPDQHQLLLRVTLLYGKPTRMPLLLVQVQD